MRQPLKTRPSADELDRLVDDVLADPSRADEVKCLLRSRMRTVERMADDGTDDLDLWENVPI